MQTFHLAPYTLAELIKTYKPSTAILIGLFVLLALFSLIYTIVYLIVKYGWLLAKREPFVFMELVFPSHTSKSPYSTEQLFSQLHSLAKQRKLLGKQGYSLEIAASKEKGIRYILGATKEDALVIEKGLLSYLPGLKIRRVGDYLPETITDDRSTNIIEFKLKGDFAFPLQRHQKLSEHDPISYLTGNMTKLNKDELMIFQAVITPLRNLAHNEELSHIKKLKRNIYYKSPLAEELFQKDWRKIFSNTPLVVVKWFFQAIALIVKFILSMFTLFIDHSGKTTPLLLSGEPKKNVANPYEEQLSSEVKSKIEQPLFETSLRLLVKTDHPSEVKPRVSGFLASLDSLGSSFQSLILRKRKLNFENLGRLFKERKVALTGNSVLSVSELADIYHFPHTDTTKTEDLVKSHSQDLPAPLSLKNNYDLDVIFGLNNYGNVQTDIGLTDDDRSRHMYLIGQTGSGKSTIIHHMASDDIKKGRGLCVVDPHGDLAEGLLDVIPTNRINDVIYFNPFDVKYPIGINLLELTPGLEDDEAELEKEVVCESVISVFRRIFRKDENVDAHRIEYILRNTIYTAYTVPDCTIFTVYELLTDPPFRKQVTRALTDKNLAKFWKNEFGKAGDYQVVKMASGVTAKIGRFLFSPIAKRILEQKHSTIDFDDIVDNGKVLICNLAEGKLGEDTAQILGTAIISKIHLAMTRRAQMEAKKRKPFYLFVDEFQNFATGSFTKLLSGGRKYGLRITIAEQSTAQQDDRNIINVILANVGTVVCFRTASPVDESLMMPQFAPLVDIGNIANLPRHHFYIKLAALEPEDTFSGETLPITTEKNEERRKRIVEASRKNYGTEYKETKTKPVLQMPAVPVNEAVKTAVSVPEIDDEGVL